jgi:phosphoribosylaminoimidazole-succinocarboxamide synthase
MIDTLVAWGKTKSISLVNRRTHCGGLDNKDVVTWDDTYSEPMEGKGAWATTTTCNVFELLKRNAIPVAYVGRSQQKNRFYATLCTMIPVEVIIRFANVKNSSYSKRYPDVPLGPFKAPVVEFNLKTVKKVFNGQTLDYDDPLIADISPSGLLVCNPKAPVVPEGGMVVPYTNVFQGDPLALFASMSELARKTGVVLRDAWAALGWTLGDFKIEFGITPDGKLVIADVIDNDSWRILDPNGIERSKQRIRDDKFVSEESILSYRMVAEASNAFG